MEEYQINEKAVFVGIIKKNDDETKINEYLDELKFLAETAGIIGDKTFIQKVDRPDGATYIRSGKVEEIGKYCEENEIRYCIFDDELTGMQQRNIERLMQHCIVIDRTAGKEFLCKNAGGTCKVQLHAPPPCRHVDPPRKTEGWPRNPRRNG